MIAARTKAALARRVGKGILGNRTNLAEASALGVASIKSGADAFATGVIPIIEDLQARGETIHSIAAELNVRRVRTARGGEWSATQVQRVLRRAV